ncbi:MAG: electron transfer flavoprotein subunit alpha/FixB family protein [Dehalococcoidia bacterium]|nr:MAG: electron transfer flavoprotein subunit alpha/FixB family protein [Dehalococcoidia bacterium]
MAEYKGVMIYGEVKEGKLAVITTELLGCGRRLADDLGQELCAVLLGSNVSSLVQEAIAFGADKVYVVDDPLLKDYQTDSYVSVMEKAVRQVMPQILILGQTSIGRDLAPRLAFRLGTAASTDCIELAIDPDSKLILQTKPVYGGNAQAIFTCESYPQIATVRAKAMSPLERDDSRQGEVITIEADLDPSAIRTKVLEKVREEVEGIKLEEAEVVVSGGRGIGDADGFKQLEELAKILEGAVGATRPACDNGWVPDALQVGLTGKIVAPTLYIAVALSGSSQHMTGCAGSKNIVAINKDPEANIFREAHFGVVGDWKKVLPAFTSKVKELLAE